MKYRIIGDTMPAIEVMFDAPGEGMYTQSGGMAWMTEGIEMSTNTKGGLMKGIGRMFSGESLFMATYRKNLSGGCNCNRRNDLPEGCVSVCSGECKLKYYLQQKNISRVVWRGRFYSSGFDWTRHGFPGSGWRSGGKELAAR